MNCKKVILSLLKRTKSIEEINEVQAFIEDVNTKLDKLVSGTNIKTVDGLSLLGLGNINTKSYHIFSNSWDTSTIKNLCNSMVADSNVGAGMAYYGKFTGTGLPSGLGQAEMIVEVIADDLSNGKSLHLNVFSADTSPYKWEAQYVKINGSYPSTISWKAYLLEGGLATVATSGDYDDLINKPELDDMSLVIASALNDLNSRLSNCVLSEVVHNVVVCTQAEYDTLVTNNEVDPNTEYNIIEVLS